MLRAGVVLMTHGVWDAMPGLISGARWVQLWHGTPIKSHGLRTPPMGTLPWERRPYDILLAPSERFAQRYRNMFNPPAERVLPIGAPRLDGLFRDDLVDENLVQEAELILRKGRIVLYLPTWRPWLHGKGIESVLRMARYDSGYVEKQLKELEAVLVLKPHPSMRVEDMEWTTGGSKRIVVLDDDIWFDMNPLLRRASILVTDYSSVFYDVLQLHTPCVFLAPDLNRFKEEGIVPATYEAEAPGPVVSTWSEALSWVRNLLEGEDPFRKRRMDLTYAVWAHVGPGHAARVAEELMRVLGMSHNSSTKTQKEDGS